MDQVDVEAILSGMAAQQGQQLNWRSSIVDLLKLLNIDSSLQARKELAQELDYTGDTSDSASMNIWLHRQVMNRLAANGGKVPADLRDRLLDGRRVEPHVRRGRLSQNGVRRGKPARGLAVVVGSGWRGSGHRGHDSTDRQGRHEGAHPHAESPARVRRPGRGR